MMRVVNECQKCGENGMYFKLSSHPSLCLNCYVTHEEIEKAVDDAFKKN